MPSKVASRLQGKNRAIEKKGSVTQVFLSGNEEADAAFVESLPESEIFMFDRVGAKTLLKYFFLLRERYPHALCYCECGPEDLPILAYAGFDLFPYSPENEAALAALLENPTPEYIEMQACATLGAKQLLDVLYRLCWEEHEKYISRPHKKELYISRDAFSRPHAKRWERDVPKYYSPHSDVILLLPCSARKPYGLSKSHRKFISIARRALRDKYDSLCQLIVTSPYGIVPRELETLIDYDIVVTGSWYAEEKERAQHMLEELTRDMESPVIIAHLPEDELEATRSLDATVIPTVVGHPTSHDSLSNLYEALSIYKDRLDAPTQKLGHLRTLSRFLFGIDIFPDDKLRIKGRSVRQIYHNRLCVASWQDTLRPINVTSQLERKWVQIGFELKGDLFCAGVQKSDPSIRPGDDVLVYNGTVPVAAGIAVLNGDMMKKMKNGKAVKIKKRIDRKEG